MPISPSSSALPGRPCTSAMPWRRACAHCSALMAGCCDASAVPRCAPSALRTSRPARCAPAGKPARKSCLTPQSTTVNASPCWRASTLTAAPPDKKFSTICQLTSLGNAETPCAVMPWSPAKTTICGCWRTGLWLPRISPSCRASASSRPSEPSGLVLLSKAARKAWVRAGSRRSFTVGKRCFIAAPEAGVRWEMERMQAWTMAWGLRPTAPAPHGLQCADQKPAPVRGGCGDLRTRRGG